MMLYIHLPFCKQKCKYCAFCSGAYPSEMMERYVKKLISLMPLYLRGKKIGTVYIGGGTPSVLPLPLWMRLLDALREYTHSLREFTVELNPESTTQELLKVLKSGGVDRLSFGVQSLNDGELRAVGRLHSAEQALSALRLAKEAGFENISADLIYGLPTQTPDSFESSLKTLINENITHLSCYNLQLEEGTPLYNERKDLSFPDEDAQMEMYDRLIKHTRAAGFEHYEISNFAKAGYRALHNGGYWTGEDYIGLGTAAHSKIGRHRYAFSADIGDFLANDDGRFDECVALSKADIHEESIMLGLRTDAGVPLSLIDTGKVQKYVKMGLGQITDERFILNDKGFMLSNSIITDLI